MKYKNEILPFNQFWVNCDFNSRFSILSSVDKNFEKLAYYNAYKYVLRVSDYDSLLYGIHLECDYSDYEECLSYIPVHEIRGNDNIETVIKNMVMNNDVFMLGVDLFHYIPGSICWEKFHWYHYSLIKGFDDTQKVFYVLDDNLSGYNEFEVPTNELINAANANQMDFDAYRVVVNTEKIKQFNTMLDIETVKKNAASICENIEELEDRTLWVMSEANIKECLNKDLDSMYLYQIRNRQLANQLLFKYLEEADIASMHSKYDYVINAFGELETGWKILQKEFIKIYHSKQRATQVEKANKRCRELLKKECEIWKYVIQEF